MKKLIPTIAMTLLGASLLGTSSFAWFSANTSATAEGLQIKAQAASSLLISESETGDYKPKAKMEKLNSPSATMEPVTIGKASGSASTDTVDFKKITDETKKHINSNGEFVADETFTEAVYTDTTTDYIKSQIWVLYSGSETSPSVDVTAKLSAENPSDGIYKAVHVALYEPGAKTADAAVFDFTFSAVGTATAAKNFSVVSKTAKGFDVYVWVEGTSGECYNANAINGDLYSVSLSFTLHSSN